MRTLLLVTIVGCVLVAVMASLCAFVRQELPPVELPAMTERDFRAVSVTTKAECLAAFGEPSERRSYVQTGDNSVIVGEQWIYRSAVNAQGHAIDINVHWDVQNNAVSRIRLYDPTDGLFVE